MGQQIDIYTIFCQCKHFHHVLRQLYTLAYIYYTYYVLTKLFSYFFLSRTMCVVYTYNRILSHCITRYTRVHIGVKINHTKIRWRSIYIYRRYVRSVGMLYTYHTFNSLSSKCLFVCICLCNSTKLEKRRVKKNQITQWKPNNVQITMKK